MPFELNDIIQIGLRTTQKPKFEVYDTFGSAITLVEPLCSFSLKNATSGTEVISASGGTDGFILVDNKDTDAAGNDIKTIQVTLDMSDTDITAGRYWLMIFVTLSNGETDRFKIQIDAIDFQDVGETPVS